MGLALVSFITGDGLLVALVAGFALLLAEDRGESPASGRRGGQSRRPSMMDLTDGVQSVSLADPIGLAVIRISKAQ